MLLSTSFNNQEERIMNHPDPDWSNSELNDKKQFSLFRLRQSESRPDLTDAVLMSDRRGAKVEHSH